MKKVIITLAVLGIGGAIGGYIYLKNSGRAESTIEKNEDRIEAPAEVIETTSGIELVDLGTVTEALVSKAENSEVFFEFDGVTGTKGTFGKMEANFVSTGDIATAKIDVKIDVTTINTNNSMRDGHLQGADFFNVEKWSEVSYHSEKIELTDSGYVAIGAISFLGLEKELQVPFNYKGMGKYDDGSNFHVFEGAFPFNHVEYGMQENMGAPNEVNMTFYLEMIAK